MFHICSEVMLEVLEALIVEFKVISLLLPVMTVAFNIGLHSLGSV